MTRVEKIISVCAGLLGLVGTVIGIVAQYNTMQQQEQVTKLNSEIRRLEASLREREMNLAVSLKVYEKFEKINYNDARDLKVAAALLEILPHPEFKKKMADFIKSVASVSDAEGAEEIGKLAKFVADEAVLESALEQKKSSNYVFEKDGWDYDVFWCAVPGKSEQENPYRDMALTAVDIIREQAQKPVGYVRLRQLPVSVNQQPGYQITGNVIHSDQLHDENTIAAVIESALNGNAAFTDNTVRHEIADGGSEWYISVFFCPDDIAAD
jgi:hypothetical protein